MRKVIYAVIILLAALLVVGTLMVARKAPSGNAPASTALPIPEAEKGPLPKVITLYQKGEGESELAAFVAKELSRELKDQAVSRAINVLAEPQMAEFYGVSTTPAVIILSPAGQILFKHEGYLDKAEIIKRINSLKS